MRVAPQRGYNPNRAGSPLFGKSSLQRESGHTLTPAAIARSWRRLKRCVAGLLCGTGVLCCRAWPAVRAEDGHLHAAVLLPVVPGLFVIHRLVLAESDDLDAVHGHIALRYKIGVDSLGAPAAEFEVVFGRAGLVREAFNGHKGALHASVFPTTGFAHLLLAFVGQLPGT